MSGRLCARILRPLRTGVGRWHLRNIAPLGSEFVREVKIDGSEVRAGNVLERKGRIVEVLSAVTVRQGRGAASVQLEMRDLQDGTKHQEKLRPNENVEKLKLDMISYNYLYTEGNSVVLMHPQTFEQVEVPVDKLGTAAAYLTEGMPVTLSLLDDKPIIATIPAQLTCKVALADPFMKGQTATASYKTAVLENGIKVMVPTFIDNDELIVVNTADNTFVKRAKE